MTVRQQIKWIWIYRSYQGAILKALGMLWISHPNPPHVFLITFSYGHICFCIFVAEGFVPPFEWKCIWSEICLALIWKFRIWICGFYKIEPFQSVVITPTMFEFSVGKCLHFTRGQNNHITWLWRSKYFRTHVCHGGQGKIFNLSYLLGCW